MTINKKVREDDVFFIVIFEIFDFGDLEKFIVILSLCPFLALDPRAVREDDTLFDVIFTLIRILFFFILNCKPNRKSR